MKFISHQARIDALAHTKEDHSILGMYPWKKVRPGVREKSNKASLGRISSLVINTREKGRDLTQPYDKSPYTYRKIEKCNVTKQKRHKKLRLHNDCGPT